MNYLQDNTIIICENSIKISLLKELTNSFLNIKFYTKNDFLKEYYCKYDEKTLYYLINKYNYKIDIAKMYLDNLIYVDEKKIYKSDKLNYLVKLKKELDDNNLLIYNPNFLDEISKYNIVVLNYPYLEDYEVYLFNKLNAKIINESGNNKLDKVYVLDTIEDEINFVSKKISDLLLNKVDINNIKLMGMSDNYYNDLERIFKYYNIPIKIPSNNTLISNNIAKIFIDNLEKGIDYSINLVKDKNSDIVNKIIDICNKYVYLKDDDIKYKLIIDEFKNTTIDNYNYKKYVDIININDYVKKDDYVFYLNFNNSFIPKIIIDEDYICDNLKKEVGLKDSNTINKLVKEYEINKLKSINNLTITCKLKDNNGECYKSSLVDELNLECVYPDNNIINSYSYLNDLINYSKLKDNYYKYGTITDNYLIYKNNIKDNIYNTFDNKYHKINKNSLIDYLNKKITLSYSSISNYYKCAFRYYLTNILKIDKYEDSFEAFIGSIFHDVLEKCFKDNLNIDEEINNYIKNSNKELTIKERFYVNIIKEDIKNVIDVLNKQKEYISLDNSFYEKNIEIDKGNNIKFVGKIDKIMFKEDNGNTVVSIIDYKTGNVNSSLNNIKDGINLQLPIYLYLVKRSNLFNNPLFAGFYVQNILNKDILKDNSKTYEEEFINNLKLNGYSNSSIHTLSLFDSSYENSKLISGIRVKKDGNFYKNCKVLSNDEMNILVDEVEKVIDKGINNILDANFNINPKKIETDKDIWGCSYCKFKDICFMSEKDIVTIKKNNLDFLGGDDNERN